MAPILGMPALPPSVQIVIWERCLIPIGADAQELNLAMNAVAEPGRDINSYISNHVSENAARLVKKGEKAGLTLESDHSLEAMKTLHHQMVLPYSIHRFGEGLAIVPFELLQSWGQARSVERESVFVCKEGERIAGCLLFHRRYQRETHLLTYGLLPSYWEDKVVRSTYTALLNRYAFEQACLKGYRVNLGLTLPYRDDGVLEYKKRWGCHLERLTGSAKFGLHFPDAARDDIREAMRLEQS